MNEIELLQVIKSYHEKVDIPCDTIDIGITLNKMSQEQRDDLAAMIQWLHENTYGDDSYLLYQVLHDLNGLKAVFLGLPEGQCFSPRSSGYAKKFS